MGELIACKKCGGSMVLEKAPLSRFMKIYFWIMVSIIAVLMAYLVFIGIKTGNLTVFVLFFPALVLIIVVITFIRKGTTIAKCQNCGYTRNLGRQIIW